MFFEKLNCYYYDGYYLKKIVLARAHNILNVYKDDILWKQSLVISITKHQR